MESLFSGAETVGAASDAAARAARIAVPARHGHFDELRGCSSCDASRERLAPQWEQFFNTLGLPGLAQLDDAAQTVDQQIRENGITYNVYADPNGPSRPWSLDLLPWVVSAKEWAGLESGLAQRAELLERILHDLYGEQRLLHDNLLPAAITVGHPAYVRPMRWVVPAGGVFLHIAAFDLARGPDGTWRVVSERTQAPSGLGYALENRVTINKLFPSAFRQMKVQHLASTYRALLDSLLVHCPRGTAGKVVLLTPGPYNETYFEQAYLARYLGIPLVEGGDLTVRDQRVFLKTLHGLEQVDAILRRLDDDYCDPLELRSDSALGVPGLMQAVRAGHVLLANSLGSGFLESAAIQGFLPAVCRELMGQELELTSLPTWWCGEDAALEDALPKLGQLVVKSTWGKRFTARIGAHSTEDEIAALEARIRANPADYTLQEFLPLSQLPTWSDGRIVPRAAMLRAFVIRDANGGWKVLPGGLVRTAHSDQLVVSMQSGGSSADAWVLTDGAVDEFSLLPGRMRPEQIAGRRRVVSSRSAENLFWLGRYTERAEHGVRLARQVLTALATDDEPPRAVLDVLTQLSRYFGLVNWESPSIGNSRAEFERVLTGRLGDPDAIGSIANNLASLERSAGHIRDRLAPDHWRLIVAARTDLDRRLAPGRLSGGSIAYAQRVLSELADDLSAITGAQADRMTRDDGWRLLSAGRQIERLSSLATSMLTVLESGAGNYSAGLELLIGLFDSIITYRSIYQRSVELPAVTDLLVLDRSNPRSLAYVYSRLIRDISRLPGGGQGNAFSVPDPDAWQLAALCRTDAAGVPRALTALARALCSVSRVLSDELSRRYFSLADGWVRPVMS
ncbi:circularly permuted type 2 ATP-grasp protein [Derxia gummosa]|uniref:Circularly permuted type 2 ATP-grasp protein n=1 Tax=Derxia gummosa DSM 723 TaxID=1121388 RepID=A0A8B6X8E6_9BURK|nr:circularly permuted type 2 ATP-grasp protein [Derxia gummosa]